SARDQAQLGDIEAIERAAGTARAARVVREVLERGHVDRVGSVPDVDAVALAGVETRAHEARPAPVAPAGAVRDDDEAFGDDRAVERDRDVLHAAGDAGADRAVAVRG